MENIPMKREGELRLDNSEEAHQLANYLTLALHSNEINRPTMVAIQQHCESLSRDIAARLALPVTWNTTYKLVHLLNMKLKESSTQQLTSNLKRPNPPTAEAIKKAQFVDKTYNWTGR